MQKVLQLLPTLLLPLNSTPIKISIPLVEDPMYSFEIVVVVVFRSN